MQKSDSYKYLSSGRFDNMQGVMGVISNSIDEGSTNKGELLKPHLVLKNMDNNLKDFLKSAHQKFNPDSDENEINILLVCCDDSADMQSWVGYLYACQGLFTKDSFHSKMSIVMLIWCCLLISILSTKILIKRKLKILGI